MLERVCRGGGGEGSNGIKFNWIRGMSVNIFLISPKKHTFWILIGSALL